MASVPKRKPKREELKADEVLCDHCTAKCCRYYAFPIDEPRTWKDFDYIRWTNGVVPEPGTFGVLAAGALLALARRRRR